MENYSWHCYYCHPLQANSEHPKPRPCFSTPYVVRCNQNHNSQNSKQSDSTVFYQPDQFFAEDYWWSRHFYHLIPRIIEFFIQDFYRYGSLRGIFFATPPRGISVDVGADSYWSRIGSIGYEEPKTTSPVTW